MITIRTVEEELSDLKKSNEHDSFQYDDVSVTFSSVCNAHFKQVKRPDKYGIYIVRQKPTNHILYIGKSGTISSQGEFSAQDIPGRLTNRKRKTSSNEWFRSLVSEKGAIVVEYIFLDRIPTSPALVESVLLQAYLNQHGGLPYRNNEF